MALEQLTDAMRKQADGLSHGEKMVWDNNKMEFIMVSDEEYQLHQQHQQQYINNISSRSYGGDQ